MAAEQHHLSDKDTVKRTAVCSVCGPTKIESKGSGKWRCRRPKAETNQALADLLVEKAEEANESETKRQNRSLAAITGREQLFLEQLKVTLKKTFSKPMPRIKPVSNKKKKPIRRILNLAISDTHYGSFLDRREVGHSYGAVEEARRTAAICRQVAEYKIQYRNETELFLHILGDIIQGQLHDMRDGLPLTDQVAAAMRILAQVLRYLSVQFPLGVTVFCTPGNHGRNSYRHRDRATNQKWDSIETMVYLALKEVAMSLPNVKVVLGYEPKYDFETFGSFGIATHGDTVINPGYPGRSIDVANISKQINSINNSRVLHKKEPYRVVVMGHVHVGSMTNLPGGVVVITNGCLIPPDAYANSIGIFDTSCGQWLWESVEGHPVGDARFIIVDEKSDADASLDKIIAPYQGF